MHLGHDVGPVDLEVVAGRSPQRGVQHGAVLGGVDVPPGEHRVATLLQPHLRGEVEQRLEDVVLHERLGQVDVQVARVEGQSLDPVRVLGEPATQVGLELVGQVLEPCPRLGGRGVPGSAAHDFWASRLAFTVSSSSFQDFSNFSTPSSSSTRITSS